MTNQIHPRGHSDQIRAASLLSLFHKIIQMVAYESENLQISSDFKYVHLYYVFDYFGTCTKIILQAFVNLEVLKGTPLGWGV